MNALHALFSRLLPLACCLFMTSSALAASSVELSERNAVKQEALSLFRQQNWQGLDALAGQYRDGLPATPGGAQKLSLIYTALRTNFANRDSEAERAVNEWIAANPKSPSAHILKSMTIEARASRLRGDGPIQSVNRAILPEYQRLLAQSARVLLDGKEVAQADPMWYAQMIMLAKLQGDSSGRRQWLKEGSDRFPEFQNIYLEAMIGALPKWGGSPGEIEQIARLAVEKTRNKTGLSLYAYVWYNAFTSQPDLMPLLARNKIVNWDDMRQGWNDRIKIYPDQWSRNGYLTNACLAGDKETFNEQSALLEGSENVIGQLWLRGLSFQACQNQLQ